ncbi:bifunctional diguanylate cyclase/phosphodiesterase [Pantoea sp. FN060301]|uniref:bifunctional diguanylate cyclase/phosphodiesterase n=1 Tax=Pantoea sp. FN060301 TaxID=3420380 RepID=UPI003D182487
MSHPPELSNLAAGDDQNTTVFTRRLLTSLTLLLSGVMVMAMLMVVGIAWQQNKAAVRQESALLENAWNNSRQHIMTDVRDYAFWGEAWNNLHLTVNTAWAFDEQNFGPGLYSEYHYEGVFVVDGMGVTRYAVVNGKLENIQLESWLGAQTALLVRRVRALAADENALTQNVMVGTTPAIIAAAPITNGKVSGLKTIPGPPSVMIFVNRFTPEKLKAFGDSVGVKNARIPVNERDKNAQPFLQEEVAESAPLVIRWDTSQPGQNLLIYLLPALFISAIVLALVARRLTRYAMHNAALSDRRFAQLTHSQRELAASEARFRDVAEASSDWIWEIDIWGKITYLSSRFAVVTGFETTLLTGRPIDEILHHDRVPVSSWIFRQRTEGQRKPLRCYSCSAQGMKRICSLVANPVTQNGEVTGYRGTVSDITEEVEAQARIHYLSQHDALTGLPNRHYMREFLQSRLLTQPTQDRPLVVISLDLDHFKPINDTWGHAVGDAVLNDVSHRLRSVLSAGDLVSREGGDEFILIVSGLSCEAEINACCQALLEALALPFCFGQQELFMGGSIGIALAPRDANQPDELLRLADIALFKSKREGRNRWSWYTPEMAEHLFKRREMERNLRLAIAGDELRLFYQPRYCLQKGRAEGAEALIRWEHPATGLIMPDCFIPLAEETGLIIDVSEWVLLRACTDALSLPGSMYVSVNISPVEFRSGNLAKRVANALAKSGLAASRLELEITENITLENPQSALEIMRELKKIGVKLTVDDFGAGYASLGFLKNFPFDGMKLDRSYMHDFPHCRQAYSIVEGIIGLGKAFSLTVTAEGIETREQLEELKIIACQEGQGYYLGRPVPLNIFLQQLEKPVIAEESPS